MEPRPPTLGLSDLGEAALEYARRGIPVFPLHGIRDGHCTCLRPTCDPKKAGKHPRTTHGFKDATTDETTITQWWTEAPDANIGTPTDWCTVLDVDPRNGGDATLHDLERRHGPLPYTPEVLTGGGGRHIYFRRAPVRNGAGRLGPGLDVKGDGGYVVLPPSQHASGRRYEDEILAPLFETLLAEIPPWILACLASSASGPGPSADAPIPEGRRNEALYRVGRSLHAKGLSRDAVGAALLAENRTRCRPPLSDAEVRSIAEHVMTQANDPSFGRRPHDGSDSDSGGRGPDQDHDPAGAPELATEIQPAEVTGSPQEEALTDLGNARRLVRRHGRNFHYVYKWESFIVWDGPRWKRDDGDRIMAFAKQTVESLFDEAKRAPSTARATEIAKWAVTSQNVHRLEAMIKLAQSEPGVPVEVSALDADPYLLGTPTGTLDLRTLTLLRSPRREDLITLSTRARWEGPEARHPLFDAFLERVLPNPELRAFVQRVAGYCLTGVTEEEAVFFVYGPTASGKSTLTEALRRTFGDYAMTADFTSFLERRRGIDGSAHREDIARLAPARLVASVEVRDGSRLAVGLVKLLSGGDTVTARRPHERAFEFAPRFKLWLAANARPKVDDEDEAAWRRIKEVPFSVSIPPAERDKTVKRRLINPAVAGPAILAWAARGCQDWLRRKALDPPKAVEEATEDYRRSMDPLADFVAACCRLDPQPDQPSLWVSAKLLRDTYETWCRENGVRYPLQGKAFAGRRRTRQCAPQKRGEQRGWLGIDLRTYDAPADPDAKDLPW
jgi:putative DNA primase/helicase